jgi:F-type H+-transporting ATPase subunit delta
MSENPLKLKMAAPYARAIFDYTVKKNMMHLMTADFQNLDTFLKLKEANEFLEYLDNPIVSKKSKRIIVIKILKGQVNPETFKFLMFLVDRGRINLLREIVITYIEIIYQTARIKLVELSTASSLNYAEKESINRRVTKMLNARGLRLVITVDPTLIGGFVIKTESKVLDFSLKNQLQRLAKHLDTVLEI